jgi:hypothetical protein
LAIPNIEEQMSKPEQKRPFGLVLASAMVMLEGAFLGFLGSQLLLALFAGETQSFTTSLALLALVLAAAAWLIFVSIKLFAGRRWARSAAVFWQLVQLAVASASFSGQFGSQAIGWLLIIPSVFVMVLLFTKKVIAATSQTSETDLDL